MKPGVGADRSSAAIEPLGDAALLVRLGERIDDALNRRALALADLLCQSRLSGIRDVSAAYASVCVRYDAAAWADSARSQSPYERIADAIAELIRDAGGETAASEPRSAGVENARGEPEPVEIPVCYGGDHGADIAAVAELARIDVDAVIARHSAGVYRVAMLGFMPGFAYLLGLDPALHSPRRATPRTRVPAGSVAIGGAQTGIYPRELPGGWQLIGRTPLTLFDPRRSRPALLSPGQSVRFRPIDPGEFARLSP
jgi:KipI family sensor histidine kinase inhibitor